MARTRSSSAHKKVVEAAIELVAERGVESTSMDAIAETSGVSKATIYKHWRNKDALMLEIMADVNGLDVRPAFDSGDARADMVDVLAYRPEERAGIRERIMPHLMVYSAVNEEFGRAWRNMAMDPPRRELRRLLKHAITRGELTPNLDVDLSLAVLLGPMIYWYVFLRRKMDQAPRILAEGIVDVFFRAYGVKKTPSLTKRARVTAV